MQNTDYLKSQDKGYQETIDQTDLELATDKSQKFTSIVIVYKFLHKKVRLLISYNSSSSRLPCLWRKNLTYFTFPDFRVSDIIWILA